MYLIISLFPLLPLFICREGQLTHLFFPGRVGRGYGPDWTVAVSPSLRRQDLVPHLVGKVDKMLVEMVYMVPYGLILRESEAIWVIKVLI